MHEGNVPRKISHTSLAIGNCLLQMHVVKRASYDVLLGRPFDVLMSCTVRNDRSGRQEIEVTCPNSGKRLTIPTYARGDAPASLREPTKGFQSSRI